MGSIGKNYFYTLLNKIATFVFPLAITYHVSRALGVDNVGKISYVNSISSCFVMFATMGITVHGSKVISYYQDDKKMRSIVFFETKIIQFITSLIALISYIVLSLVSNNLLFLVYSINILAVAVDITWLYQGMEEFRAIGLRNTFVKMIYCILVLLFVKKPEDIYLYALLTVASTLIGNLTLWFSAFKLIVKVPVRSLMPLRQLKSIISLLPPTIAVEINGIFDKTLLGLMTENSTENGFYQQANTITMAALSLVTILGTVMMPRIGFYYNRGLRAKIISLVYKGLRYSMMIAIPISMGIMCTAKNLIPWYLGNGYEGAIVPLRILALLIVIIGLSNYIGVQYLVPIGKQNFLTISVVFGCVTNIILDIIMIPKWYSIGAAIATIVSESVIVCIQFIFIRKDIHIKVLLQNISKYIVSGLIMSLITMILTSRFSPSTANILLTVIMGATTYVVMLFVLKDEAFLGIMSILKNRFNSFKKNF